MTAQYHQEAVWSVPKAMVEVPQSQALPGRGGTFVCNKETLCWQIPKMIGEK
jgi:hypothetical protein